MDEAKAIEDLKTLIRDTEAKLERYSAALALLEAAPSLPSPKKPATKKEDRFKRKYEKPAQVYVREEFEAAQPGGLSIPELRERLTKRELDYDPQGTRVTVKKMETKGILRRINAKAGEAVKYRWILVDK